MLTIENYFSREMMIKYMSTSQYKSFENCEAGALAELMSGEREEKDSFKEGHYFEAFITGNEELFIMQNPEIVSSRGTTKGDVKSNFKRVEGSVLAFKKQPMFMDKLARCEKQVVVTGEIAGVLFKGMVDFLDPISYNGYDTKCMKDFKKVWSNTDKMHVSWYFAYGYNYQAAIYAELIRQTFGKTGVQHILAVTKEEVPDVCAFYFSDEILENALEIIKEFAPYYDKVKKGIVEPERCEQCSYCKATKIISQFEMVGEFE